MSKSRVIVVVAHLISLGNRSDSTGCPVGHLLCHHSAHISSWTAQHFWTNGNNSQYFWHYAGGSLRAQGERCRDDAGIVRENHRTKYLFLFHSLLFFSFLVPIPTSGILHSSFVIQRVWQTVPCIKRHQCFRKNTRIRYTQKVSPDTISSTFKWILACMYPQLILCN